MSVCMHGILNASSDGHTDQKLYLSRDDFWT